MADTLDAELLLDVRNGTGESPVWHAGEQALYWVDIPQRTLYRYRLADASLHHWRAPEMLACLARGTAPGEWIAGAESGLYALQAQDGAELACLPLAMAGHAMPGMRFNDGRCDRQGRFLAGTMLMDMAAARPVGVVCQWQPGVGLRTLLRGYITPNGMAFSPDGRTMYLSDSHASVRSVWAFDYDTDTGTPGRARPFIDMAGFAGRPDGAAVDSDGCYWICGNDAGLVHRYTPAGVRDRSVRVPVPKPAMCAFGGTDLHSLYITTIRPAGCAPDAPDGGVFAIRLPSVQGLPEPACSAPLPGAH